MDVKSHKCLECDTRMSNYNNLLAHMACVHYKETLTQFYGENDRKCKLCNKECHDERKLLSHLVLFHKCLNSILPLQNPLKIVQNDKPEMNGSKMENGLNGSKMRRSKDISNKESTRRLAAYKCNKCSKKYESYKGNTYGLLCI